MIEKKIEIFVRKLASTKVPDNCVNQYSYTVRENKIRRDNLKKYLQIILNYQSSILLVGEAPGYLGCRRTGIPFSSEKIILTNRFFTESRKFSVENRLNPLSESSATIVWKIMDDCNFYPLIWSSFPFHPHLPGNPSSNRTPTMEEMQIGKKFIQCILELTNVKKVVAVGRVAEKSLSQLGINADLVRHPAHGGANLFKSGILEIVGHQHKSTKILQLN